MDVSGWDIASRMKLPDYLFGQRTLIGCYGYNSNPATKNWGISTVALPDPACIWTYGYVSLLGATGDAQFRVGLLDVIPTNEAEMDAAQDFIPYYGYERAGPNLTRLITGSRQAVHFQLRLGLATGGRKLVIQNENMAGVSRFQVYVLVSELPTLVPGWPGAWPAG